MFPNLVDWFSAVSYQKKIGRTDCYVHTAVRNFPYNRLERTRSRATQRRQNHPSERKLTGPEDLAFVEIENR